MTNREKYRTIKERSKAFKKFCKSKYGCSQCQCYKTACMTKKSFNCRFAWLDLEAEDEKDKSDKVVLTNEEKYKSVEEQAKAFLKFCSQHFGTTGKSCIGCPAAFFRTKLSCDLVWLKLKADE